MTRPFDPRSSLRGLERSRVSAAFAEPERFLVGDPANGFYTTPAPPDLGYWGVTFHSKRINSDLENPGNLLTWVANRAADLFGSDKRFVSVGAGSFMGASAFGDSNARSRAEAEQISGWKWLSNRFSPVQDVSEIDAILSFEDEDFDSESAVREFEAASPNLVKQLEEHGRDMSMFAEATNRDAFMYILNRELLHVRAQGEMARFNEDAGAFTNVSSKILSAAFNYLAFDPTFVPSMMVGVGGANLAANAAKTGNGILRVGSALTRARSVAGVSSPIRAAASAVSRAGGAPAAAYGALAGRWGTAAATGVEMSLYGMGWSAAVQQERLADWNGMFEGTEWQREFSYAELGLSGLLGGTLGYTFAAGTRAISRSLSAARIRRSLLEASDFDAESHIARDGFGTDAIRAQGHEDLAQVRIQEMAERISGNRHGDFGFLLDRKLLDDAGLLLDDVADFMETIAVALDGNLVDSLPVIRLIQEMVGQSRASQVSKTIGPAQRVLERQARNRALQRVLREIPPGQRTAPRIRAAIDEVFPAELAAISRVPEGVPNGLRADMTPDELQQFLTRMEDVAGRRPLSDIEEEQVLWAAGSLEFATGPATSKLVGRYDISGFDPGDDFGKRIMDLFRDRQELAAFRVAGDAKGVKRVQARIRRRVKRAQELFPSIDEETGKPLLRAKEEAAQKGMVESEAERARLFNEQWEAPDVGAGSWMEDITIVGRIMRSAGLGSMFSRLATEKTGQYQTVRSIMAGVRQLAELFDHSRFTVETIDGAGRTFVGNLTDQQRQLVREFAPMAEFIDKLVTEGFFGKRGVLGGKRRSRIDEFQEDAFMHAAGLREASTPEARELAEMWRDVSKRLGDEGLANGTFRDLDEAFVPIRVEIGRVMRDRVKFRRLLTDHFTRKWQDSDSVHMDTLVTMGQAERIATKGKDVTYRLTGDLAGLSDEPVSSLKRSQLGDFEEAYARGLTEAVDEQGFTGIGLSMRRAVDNLTSERTYVEESGRIITDDATGAISTFERKLDKDMLLNDELREFFRTDMMSLAHDYVRHSGMDIRANSLAQRLTSIGGMTFDEYIGLVEKQLLRVAKEGTDEAKAVRVGINELREKYMAITGRERRLLSEAEKVGEFFAETAEAGTLAFFGGGIGHSIAATEMFVGLVTRIYNPVQFAQQVGLMVRALDPRQHKAIFKEYAGYTSLSTRLWQQVNAQRFTGGSVQSDFQWGTIDKIAAPFVGVLDALTGKTAPGPRSLFGRASVVPQAIEAFGRTSFQIGGADYFTRLAWIMQLSSLQGETARFLPAARKLVDLLDESADSLRATNRQAREAALARGVDEKAAIRAGNKAQFKQWKGLVRKAGFGSRWHVARRFAEHGLLDRTMLDLLTEAGEATGALRTRGFLPMMDMTRISRYVNDIDPARADQMQDAINRVINSFEDTVRRRVSEQGILQRPTNEASRSYHGRMLNSMTTFSRSFFDNTILDMAAMPTRNAASLAAAYVLGETLNRMSKRVFNGEEPEQIAAEFEAAPVRTMLNYSFNLPLLGQYNFMLRAVTEPLLTGNAFRQDFTQGAAVSVANNTLNLVTTAFQAPFNEDARERLGHDAEKFARKLTPGLNSHWGGLFLLGAEGATGLRMRADPPRRGRGGRDIRFDMNPDNLINGEHGDVLPARDNLELDDVLDYMVPQP